LSSKSSQTQIHFHTYDRGLPFDAYPVVVVPVRGEFSIVGSPVTIESMDAPPVTEATLRARVRQLEWFSYLLDTAFAIPGTRVRIGLDGLLGLIPGVGDLLGVVLSSYIIFAAARLGASRLTLLRMLGNVALDGLVGVVPMLGDVFDIAWKANVRNVALLRAHREELGQRTHSPRQVLWLLMTTLLLLLLSIALLSFFLLRFLYYALIG
jgi:Domain of unknown function (DUF4112)